jgi:hypothetical protein
MAWMFGRTPPWAMVTPERSWKYKYFNNLFLEIGNMFTNLIQLLVVANSQLEMARIDASLLVVTSSVAGQLEDFGSQVFQHGCKIDGRAGSHAFSIVA